jgi:hypothetical protein
MKQNIIIKQRKTMDNKIDNIIGICLDPSRGRLGWQRIDMDGNSTHPLSAYFDNHPIWGGISADTIDGQAMIKIPKFYVKTGLGPAGSAASGKKCWWVSDAPRPGFSVYPAFMAAGVKMDQFWIGATEATNDGGTKAGSAMGVAPLVNIDFLTMQARCAARNTGGVEGFRMVDIYQISAVQLLMLIELGTPDVQSAIGAGNTSTSAAVNTGSSNAVWRGIYEFWGNVWSMVDGLQMDEANRVKIWDKNGNKSYQTTGVEKQYMAGWPASLHDEAGKAWDLSLVFLPKATSRKVPIIPDYFFNFCWAGEENVCYHGGHWSNGAQAGLFYLHLNSEASDSSTRLGSRLAKV